MSDLLKPADLAELLSASEQNVLRWRLQYGWPSIKVGRQIRFTSEHVAAILAQHEADQTPAADLPVVELDGQTERSRKRSA